jgi:hypothetical protein
VYKCKLITIIFRKRHVFENRNFWSNIELHIFQVRDEDGMVTTMINIILPLSVYEIYAPYVDMFHSTDLLEDIHVVRSKNESIRK